MTPDFPKHTVPEIGTKALENAVRITGVAKRFSSVVAVARVDLDVAPGELLAVVGPSGCGKTTTLRLVAGFERPDGGTIEVGGRVVAGGGEFVPPERRRVGIVFQQLALFPHLSVADNVAYGLSSLRPADRRDRVDEMLGLVGLSGYERRRPDELSGGQAQRVALARALAPRPDVVLLDEPFSSLDVGLRADVRAEVRRILRDAQASALLVTHDQDEALSMGDRVAVMLDGRVAQVGPPEDVYARPVDASVAAFLGDANLVAGRLDGDTLVTDLGALRLARAGEGARVALVRPEDVELTPAADGDAIVRTVEYYGHDQMVAVELASREIVRARLHARHRLDEGSRVRVTAADRAYVAFA